MIEFGWNFIKLLSLFWRKKLWCLWNLDGKCRQSRMIFLFDVGPLVSSQLRVNITISRTHSSIQFNLSAKKENFLIEFEQKMSICPASSSDSRKFPVFFPLHSSPNGNFFRGCLGNYDISIEVPRTFSLPNVWYSSTSRRLKAKDFDGETKAGMKQSSQRCSFKLISPQKRNKNSKEKLRVCFLTKQHQKVEL